MKKLLSLLLILILIFSFGGCRSQKDLGDLSSGSSEPAKPMSHQEEENDLPVSETEDKTQYETEKPKEEEGSEETKTPEETKPIPTPQVCSHDYRKEIIGADCDNAGYMQHTCSKCGDSYKGEEVPAGHDFSKYLCERCGKIDPNCDVFWGMNAFLSKYGTPNGKGNINCYPNDSAKLMISNYLDQNSFFIDYSNDTEGEYLSVWVKSDITAVSYRKASVYGSFEVKNSAFSLDDKIVFDDFDHQNDHDIHATECSLRLKEIIPKAEAEILLPKTGLSLNNFGFRF